MTNWQEEGNKFNKGLAEILLQTTNDYADRSVEEFELTYKYVCSQFKKFLRYYRSMGGEKYHSKYMLSSLQLGVILIKKFEGKIVLDKSGSPTTEIKLKTINQETVVDPWNIIANSFDCEDAVGNGRTIEQICLALGLQ